MPRCGHLCEQLADYLVTIPQPFIPNYLVLLSKRSEAKVGATYPPWESFGDGKVIDAAGTRGAIALENALRGTCVIDAQEPLELAAGSGVLQQRLSGAG